MAVSPHFLHFKVLSLFDSNLDVSVSAECNATSTAYVSSSKLGWLLEDGPIDRRLHYRIMEPGISCRRAIHNGCHDRGEHANRLPVA